MVDAAQAWQQIVKDAGINVKLDQLPGDTYWTKGWMASPAFMDYWTNFYPPVGFNAFYTKDASWPETHYSDPAVEKAVDDLMSSTDPTKQVGLTQQGYLAARDSYGYVIPVFADAAYARSPKVNGSSGRSRPSTSGRRGSPEVTPARRGSDSSPLDPGWCSWTCCRREHQPVSWRTAPGGQERDGSIATRRGTPCASFQPEVVETTRPLGHPEDIARPKERTDDAGHRSDLDDLGRRARLYDDEARVVRSCSFTATTDFARTGSSSATSSWLPATASSPSTSVATELRTSPCTGSA